MRTFVLSLWVILFLFGCQSNPKSSSEASVEEASLVSQPRKIVSLSGSISEVLVELGLEESIAGVDVTTTFPPSLEKLPRLGHVRNLSAEGVLSLGPDLVLAFEGELNPALKEQLEGAGLKLVLFEREWSVKGLENLISSMGKELAVEEKAAELLSRLEREIDQVRRLTQAPKVLFIYARGAGTLMVGGKATAADAMIQLVGGSNAVESFEDFKPLTAESLVEANPDFILLFDSGLESLGGLDGLLEVPGVALTNAGRDQRFIAMDGQLLLGFGPRLPQAMNELARYLESEPLTAN